MLKGDLTTAKVWLAMAANTDPTFESPYMNLGELAAHDGDIDTAVALYRTALKKASDRGLIYIRLGQLMLQQNPNSRDGVRALWERGVKLTSDDEAAAKIKALLKTL
jgi:Tfp pilus assembly protein PilF